jgi:hypothetical protein
LVAHRLVAASQCQAVCLPGAAEALGDVVIGGFDRDADGIRAQLPVHLEKPSSPARIRSKLRVSYSLGKSWVLLCLGSHCHITFKRAANPTPPAAGRPLPTRHAVVRCAALGERFL